MPETTPSDPFGYPCDLWVLPPPRSSAWFPIVDWYLNWQMSKGLAYSGMHLPSETLRVSEEYEVPLPAVKPTDTAAPLLVLSHNRLPSAKCVVVDFQPPAEQWLKKAHMVALNLAVKSVHVFLPAKLSKDDAQKIWKSNFANFDARFSSDAEAKP